MHTSTHYSTKSSFCESRPQGVMTREGGEEGGIPFMLKGIVMMACGCDVQCTGAETEGGRGRRQK